MRHHTTNLAQLGFDSWLTQADADNERFRFLKTVEHIPELWDEALPYYRTLIDLYHAAMLEANEDEVFRLKEEAYNLAAKLNGGTAFGTCATDGYGTKLEQAAASSNGEAPKWGQAGSFTLDHDGMAVRIEIGGLFGIGGSFGFWPSFTAHAVDRRKPFISETGFQSFMACEGECIPELTPEHFVHEMLACYIDTGLEGKLVKIRAQKVA